MNALLLDRNFIAISVINWKKAIKLLVVGKAEMIEIYQNKLINSEKISVKLPSVIRLLVYTPFRASTEGKIKFNRFNVLIRDKFECRYCNIKLNKNIGTIDHVIPKCMGGLSTYENCVACCIACNKYKRNLTLKQAGMYLDYKPRRPTFWEIYISSINNMPIEWEKYLLS